MDVYAEGCLANSTIEEMEAILDKIVKKQPVRWGHFIIVNQAIGQSEARKPEYYKTLWGIR